MGGIVNPADWNTLKNKPTTVGGFGIADFAGSAINAQAQAGTGWVGTYAFLQGVTGGEGTVAAGSSLRYADRAGGTGGIPAGTWRMHGYSLVTDRATVWLRIA